MERLNDGNVGHLYLIEVYVFPSDYRVVGRYPSVDQIRCSVYDQSMINFSLVWISVYESRENYPAMTPHLKHPSRPACPMAKNLTHYLSIRFSWRVTYTLLYSRKKIFCIIHHEIAHHIIKRPLPQRNSNLPRPPTTSNPYPKSTNNHHKPCSSKYPNKTSYPFVAFLESPVACPVPGCK